MQFLVIVICFLVSVTSDKPSNKILPFYSIKFINEQIFITLDLHREKWHKLLSIDSIGCDAIVKYAKDHYGVNKCDFEIECYKFNIITNFNGIYQGMTSHPIPDTIGMEYEQENHLQNGIDVECTVEKYQINEKNIDNNIKSSKKKQFSIFPALKEDSMIFKGIKNITSTLFQNIFPTDERKTEKNSPNATTSTSNTSKFNLKKQGLSDYDSSETLKTEIIKIKEEITKLENEEHSIEQNILKDIRQINSKISAENSIINSLLKREFIAGLCGGILMFILFIVFYCCSQNFQIRNKSFSKE